MEAESYETHWSEFGSESEAWKVHRCKGNVGLMVVMMFIDGVSDDELSSYCGGLSGVSARATCMENRLQQYVVGLNGTRKV
jgi:hypothetical protein